MHNQHVKLQTQFLSIETKINDLNYRHKIIQLTNPQIYHHTLITTMISRFINIIAGLILFFILILIYTYGLVLFNVFGGIKNLTEAQEFIVIPLTLISAYLIASGLNYLINGSATIWPFSKGTNKSTQTYIKIAFALGVGIVAAGYLTFYKEINPNEIDISLGIAFPAKCSYESPYAATIKNNSNKPIYRITFNLLFKQDQSTESITEHIDEHFTSIRPRETINTCFGNGSKSLRSIDHVHSETKIFITDLKVFTLNRY